MYDDTFHRLQPGGDMMGVGVGLKNILALNVDCLEHAIGCGIQHIRDAQAGFWIQRHAPFTLKQLTRRDI